MIRFFVLLLLALVSGLSHAQTVPAKVTNGARFGWPGSECYDNTKPPPRSAALAACANLNSTLITFNESNGFTLCDDGNGARYQPGWSSSCSVATCPDGYNLNSDGVTCSPKVTCKPGQYVGSDGQCKCDNGAQIGSDGTCCPVTGSGGGAPFQWCQVGSPSATSCDSPGQNGCNIRCKGVTFQKGVGDQVAVFPRIALGSNCAYTGTKSAPDTSGGPLTNEELVDIDKSTKNPEKAKTPQGCLASGQGYVQTSTGTTCVNGGDTGVTEKKETTKKTEGPNGTTETTKQTSTEQGPNGTGTTTTTTTTTNPDGSKTTTTTKTTKNADGTITEEKETKTTNPDGTPKAPPIKETSTNDPGEFCQANPNSPLCKGLTDACKDNPTRIGCMDAGDLPEGPSVSTQEKGISSIGVIAVGSNATCPADLPLPKGMSFSFQPFCDYASALRPIIILLAWMTAGFMVFGYRGNNG